MARRMIWACAIAATFFAQWASAEGTLSLEAQNSRVKSAAQDIDFKWEDTPLDQRPQLRLALDNALIGASFDTAIRSTGTCALDKAYHFTVNTRIKCAEIKLVAGGKIQIDGGLILFLDAPKITVAGPFNIDGKGKAGTDGPPGSSVEGPWQSQGDSDYWAALSDCRGNPNHADRGKRGNQGGPGGPGALVLFGAQPSDLTQLKVDVSGGPGGSGGKGGNGRLYRNGRNYYCDGCTMNCPAGPQGPAGDPGPAGSVVTLPPRS